MDASLIGNDAIAAPRRGGRGRGLAPRLGLFGTAALLLVGLGGVPAATAAQAAGPGGPGYGYGYQLVPGDQPSIAVLGSGEAGAPAESGRLQMVVRAVDPYALAGASEVPVGAPGQPPVLTEDQVQPLAEALIAVGVAEEAVEVAVSPAFGGLFGPGSAQILVDLEGDDLDRADDLVQAGTTAAGLYGLYVESIGAGYRIADDACADLLREARTAAAADGLARAEALAEALDVEIGRLLLATEAPSYNDGSGFGCAAAAPVGGPYQTIYYPPFTPGAEPEVEAYVQLNLAYEISGGAVEGTPEA
jgi:uncharacterized protein YggE